MSLYSKCSWAVKVIFFNASFGNFENSEAISFWESSLVLSSIFKKYFLSLFTITSIFLLVINLNSEEKKLPNFYDNVPNEELAADIVENMTDEELLAQTFMFGWALIRSTKRHKRIS